jgi:hypothetical protein
VERKGTGLFSAELLFQLERPRAARSSGGAP